MDDREERIRERAYHLWIEEGRPHGREADHWVLAAELIAIEDNQKATLIPLDEAPAGEPVEPIEALENAGEFPTTTDQGEMQIPHRGAPDSEGPPKAAAKAAKTSDRKTADRKGGDRKGGDKKDRKKADKPAV